MAVVRVEELYPWPEADRLGQVLHRALLTHADSVCAGSKKSQPTWAHGLSCASGSRPLLARLPWKLAYAGREPVAASPAVGSMPPPPATSNKRACWTRCLPRNRCRGVPQESLRSDLLDPSVYVLQKLLDQDESRSQHAEGAPIRCGALRVTAAMSCPALQARRRRIADCDVAYVSRLCPGRAAWGSVMMASS